MNPYTEKDAELSPNPVPFFALSKLKEQRDAFLEGFRTLLQRQGPELNLISRIKSLCTQLHKQKMMEESD